MTPGAGAVALDRRQHRDAADDRLPGAAPFVSPTPSKPRPLPRLDPARAGAAVHRAQADHRLLPPARSARLDLGGPARRWRRAPRGMGRHDRATVLLGAACAAAFAPGPRAYDVPGWFRVSCRYELRACSCSCPTSTCWCCSSSGRRKRSACISPWSRPWRWCRSSTTRWPPPPRTASASITPPATPRGCRPMSPTPCSGRSGLRSPPPRRCSRSASRAVVVRPIITDGYGMMFVAALGILARPRRDLGRLLNKLGHQNMCALLLARVRRQLGL